MRIDGSMSSAAITPDLDSDEALKAEATSAVPSPAERARPEKAPGVEGLSTGSRTGLEALLERLLALLERLGRGGSDGRTDSDTPSSGIAGPTGPADSSGPSQGVGSTKGPGADFEQLVQELLGPDADGKIDEEQLFAGLLYERLSQEDQAAAARFEKLLSRRASKLQRDDGYVPIEKAAIQALRRLVRRGGIDQETAGRVYSEAFAAAQLDGREGALFDGRGGGADETVARGGLKDALISARERLEALAKGEEELATLSIDDARPTGRKRARRLGQGALTGSGSAKQSEPLDGPEGFLWKPVSDHGNLVVLLPQEIEGDAEGERDVKVSLIGPNGRVIEGPVEPASGGRRANGDRLHFRFNKDGGDYPDGLTVRIEIDGEIETEYAIPETSKRHD